MLEYPESRLTEPSPGTTPKNTPRAPERFPNIPSLVPRPLPSHPRSQEAPAKGTIPLGFQRGWRAPSWPRGLPGHPMSLPKALWVTGRHLWLLGAVGRRQSPFPIPPAPDPPRHLPRSWTDLGVLCESPGSDMAQ